MEFVAKRDELNQVLSVVSKGVKDKAVNQILETVHLKVEKGKLQITGTDLKISIRAQVPVKCEGSAELCVSGKLFAEFISNLPSGLVKMVLTEGKKLRCEGGTFKSLFATVKPEEYPQVFEDLEDLKWIRVSPGQLSEAIRSTVFCTSSDASRPALQGVQVTKEDSNLIFRSTDGHRMSRFELPILGDDEWSPSLIPGDNLQIVEKVLGEVEDVVSIASKKNKVVFLVGEYMFSSQLIASEFPDLDRILSREPSVKLVCSTSELAKTLRVMNLFAVRSRDLLARSVTLDYVFPPSELENGQLTLKIDVPEVGKSENTIDCHAEGEPGGAIRIRTELLIDAVSSLSTPQTSLGVGGPEDPVFIRKPSGEEYLHIIMPVKAK